MRFIRLIAGLLSCLAAIACVPVPVPGKGPPDHSGLKERASRPEIEIELGTPKECRALEAQWELCSYRYRYGALVWSWIGLAPPYIPLFDPTVWKAQKSGEVSLIYDGEGKLVEIFVSEKTAEHYARLLFMAKAGDPEAQYEFSLQTTKPAQIYRWLCLSARQGLAKASAELGRIHRDGTRGLRRDLQRSLNWWRLAEQQGHPEASRYRSEIAIFLSPEQIAEARRIAAVWPPGDCEAELAWLSETSATDDTLERWKQAHIRTRERAIKGERGAQWRLGATYQDGDVVEEDHKRAYFWYSLAERQCHLGAAARLEQVSVELRPEDRARLDREVERWEPGQCRVVTRPGAEANDACPTSPVLDPEPYWLAYVNKGLPDVDRLAALCVAADQGHQVARLEIARKYWFGVEPFPEDRVMAHMWQIVAARGAGTFARNQMYLHADRLSELEIREATVLAEAWKPGFCHLQLQQLTGGLTN